MSEHRTSRTDQRTQHPGAAGIADALECLGRLSLVDQDPHEAALLLGAGHAIRRATGYQRSALHQEGYDAAIRALRASMGAAEFSQAFDEGAALAIDDAVSFTLRAAALAAARLRDGCP
jgi:hypothetical protein